MLPNAMGPWLVFGAPYEGELVTLNASARSSRLRLSFRAKVLPSMTSRLRYPGPTTGERPIYSGRFDMAERKSVAEERVDL